MKFLHIDTYVCVLITNDFAQSFEIHIWIRDTYMNLKYLLEYLFKIFEYLIE